MTVVHVARFQNNPCSGVSVAVPKHVLSQQKYADVALVNVENFFVPGAQKQFEYHKGFSVFSLPEPFKKPDIVIFHEVYYPPFLKIARELKKKKIPYIVIPHGCLTANAQRKKAWKKRIGNILWFNRFVKGASAIHYLSKEEMKTSEYGQDRFVVPNGIGMPGIKKTEKTQADDSVNFLFVGRMDLYHKGLDLLLKAIATIQLFLREHHATFQLYGPDENQNHSVLRQLIAEYDIGDITFLYHEILGEEKQRVILNADFFVQTSRFEGLPMGVLEALSYGIPCLLTEGTCIGASVAAAPAGLCCATSVEAIAEMLKKAVVEKHLWKMYSANAITFVREEYELDSVATKALREYARYALEQQRKK